jgi:hypothetical protein
MAAASGGENGSGGVRERPDGTAEGAGVGGDHQDGRGDGGDNGDDGGGDDDLLDTDLRGTLDTDSPSVGGLRGSMLHEKRSAAAAAQALNFSLGAVASAATALLTCTSDLPDLGARLVIAAEVSCLTWWQDALVAVVGAVVVAVAAPVALHLLQSCDATRRLGATRLLQYAAARVMDQQLLGPVAELAMARFKPAYWYWLAVMLLHRISLAGIWATVSLTATTRALWAVAICVLVLVLHTTCQPFKNRQFNGAPRREGGLGGSLFLLTPESFCPLPTRPASFVRPDSS